MTVIRNVQDFISQVEGINRDWGLDITTNHVWFRGQTDKSWHLIPRIYRSGGDGRFERELIRDFRLQSSRFLGNVPTEELERLFIMQHYGVPTRLLDWTESHLCALYFAVLDYSNQSDACVWVLDAWSLNLAVLDQQTIPTVEHPALRPYELRSDPKVVERYVNANYPLAVRPSRDTPRIIAQRGCFTVHGCRTDGLDNIIEELRVEGKSVRIAKIEIEGTSKLALLKQLHLCGFSHSVLFPEMEALSKEICFRYSSEYLGDNRAHRHGKF